MKDRSMISKVFCLFLCAALTVGTAVSADGSMLSDGVQTEEVYLSEETDASEAAEKLFQAEEDAEETLFIPEEKSAAAVLKEGTAVNAFMKILHKALSII